MKASRPIRSITPLLLVVGLIPAAVAQVPGGPPRDVVVQTGPGGPGGFGPPGGFGMMGQETQLVKQFDQDGDGRLNTTERQAAREHLKQERANRPGPGGPGGMRFPGGGQNHPPGTPGEKISPADVKSFPDKPLYDPLTLRTFFLEFESADWEQELADFNNTDVELPAKLTVDGKTYPDIGVHFRGMSSFMMVPEGSKRSLNLSLDYVNDGQDIDGYNTLNLLNAHEDPSFIRTVLYYDVARAYLPAPKANFVRVVINGENWGIYVNAQQYNKDMVKDWFDTKKGARWKVQGSPGGQGGMAYLGDDAEAYKSIYHIKSKDDPKDWAAFIKMLKVLNETPADQLEVKLAPLLDIEGALKFLALDIALINNDGYWIRASDYSLYRDEQGKFHAFPHDANETFAMPGGPGFGGGPGGRGGPGVFGPGMIVAGQLITQGDKDADQKLTKTELTNLGEAWYDKMDSGKTGKLTQEQFVQNFGEIMPPPGFGPPGGGPAGGPGGPAGGGRGGFGPAQLIGPGFFTATDIDKDNSVTRDEFKSTFAKWAETWDVDKTGSVNEEQIRIGLNTALPQPNFGGPRGGGPGGPGGAGPGGRGGPGGGRGMGGGGAPVDGVKLDPLYIASDANKALASKLLAVPALRQRYLGYVRDIAETWLDWNKLGPIAEGYHKLIADDVKRDTRKLDTTEDFEKSLTTDIQGGGGFGPAVKISLKNFADQRRAYLLGHPEIQKLAK